MTARFWAKTGKGECVNGKPEYHPVICHLADTAAVAMAIVREYLSASAKSTLAKGLGLQGESLIKCCGFLAGCHDLGKVSPAFQFQVSEVGKALVGQSAYDLWQSYPTTGQRTPHGTVTAATLPEFLIELGLDKQLAKKIAVIVGGHHGFFPGSDEIRSLQKQAADDIGRGNWFMFRKSIYVQLQGFVELTAEDMPKQCDNTAAMILAGLTTVSDWIASNPEEKDGFPYAHDRAFDEYATELATRAEKALVSIGWSKPIPEKLMEFTELFPEITSPRELQTTSIALSKTLTPPCFVLVEASMGEGKTEAALYLADYLQHQALAGGFYIGLPTQATSNAMWDRVRLFLSARYPEDTVNLTLSHSAALLNKDYYQCRLEEQVYDEDGNRSGQVGASEWHTSRRKSLLSPYGVGTLDQALMGSVRSKWQFVRLFGLAGRTVILDEVHAYDLYTSTLLERFLEWLAALGSPVIALSATLPKSTRQRLLSAYAKGCEFPEVELPQATYPRITAFSVGETQMKSFAAYKNVSLNLNWVGSDEEWGSALQEKLQNGGCAAVICSTVGRAQKVFAGLQSKFKQEELGLFHGRFLFVDRAKIETECLIKFGKPTDSKTKRPHRYVLVATQVVEQSLDLDFDLMISDLAPIDLLLQRSGRLHRHEREVRPALLLTPNLWIIQPKLALQKKANFNESSYIYDRHILLRSWLSLRNRTNISLPQENDCLIESVYDLDMSISDEIEVVHAEDWRISLEKYRTEEEERKRTIANEVKIPAPHSNVKPEQFTYLNKGDDESAIAAATRMGEISVSTIFLQQTEQGLVLPVSKQPIDLSIKPDLTMMRELLAHSTRLSKPKLVSALLEQKQDEQKKYKNWTSALLRNCCCVVVNSQGMAVIGEWRLTLDPLRGVLIDRVESS